MSIEGMMEDQPDQMVKSWSGAKMVKGQYVMVSQVKLVEPSCKGGFL